ncbi:TPA: SIR2 family protein [Bacillus toyonensis]|nr:SIR2 family protein [Bacillus toyonensis]
MAEISCLYKLSEANEYPIIFIGSGISKRYLKDYPSWIELLEEYWNIVEPGKGFFEAITRIKHKLGTENHYDSDFDLDYDTNIEISSIIEEKFTDKFYNGEITVENFTAKQAYYTKISPFKKDLSNRFSSYEIIPEMLPEVELFQEVLNKAQIILTTNYDEFIEDAFSRGDDDTEPQVFIGQNGLFKQSTNWGEIFKIHGCVNDPESIIISEKDYERFDDNSVLISAKIISLLLNSPIIFLGYSLTDRNIRKIIKDFSNSLSAEEKEVMKDRIIIVNWKKGVEELVEYKKSENGLDCTYTVIETDNYISVFKELLTINQGVYPSEVRKFQSIIRELIVARGKKGSLKSVLISPQQLNELGDKINDENLVVALGDSTLIFKLPDLPTYMEEFFFGKGQIHTDIALKFAATQNAQARLPLFKFLKDVELDQTSLTAHEKEKIAQRIENFGEMSNSIEKISSSNKIEFETLGSILKEEYREQKEMDVISYNIDKLDLDEIEGYLVDKLVQSKERERVKYSSAFRRLALLFDIKKYKEDGR